jgi:hypothetical protein
MYSNDYSNDYHLIVAESRFREFQAEMREIHMARALHPTLLDRLVAFVSRGAHALMPGHKVGAAA